MITENLSTLKIHKLTQEQYDRELAAGNIDASALYLTPDEATYVTIEQLNANAGKIVTGTVYIIDSTEVTASVGAEVFNNYDSNKAIGNYSHAEGSNTTASGHYSHAEGKNTIASGSCSHAEGLYTIASENYSHVEGTYNIDGAYAHIVGNGTFNARSNAHTLDWDGNAWYAGTVEGTALILKSSTEDSAKRFKITVDDSGTITASEITE